MSAQSNRKTTNCNSIDRVIYLRVAVEEGSKIILVCRSAFIGDFYNNQPIGYLISKSLNFEKYIQITYLDQHLPHINFFETLGADSFFCR